MRRAVCWGLVLLVCVLAALGAGTALLRGGDEPVTGTPGSEAAGLMLLEDEDGVYVLAVADQSPASHAGVEPGDYLLEAEGVAISTSAALDKAMQSSPDPLRLMLRRGDKILQVTLDCR